MAESMVDYLEQHPGRRIMHIAGNFHVEGLGIASRIASRNPALKVALVVPGDWLPGWQGRPRTERRRAGAHSPCQSAG